MKKISKFIIKHYKMIFFLFLVASLISGIMILGLKINFSLADYMPDNSKSMQDIKIMSEEYKEPIPNLRAVIKNVSIPEILQFKEKLNKIPEVKLVLWLDRLSNITKPISTIDKSLVDNYYKNNNGLLQISVKTDNAKESLDKIKRILPKDAAYDGEIVMQSSAQNAVRSEIGTITAYAVPVGLLILMFSVKSWIEPLLLMASIGVAIVINMGTNIFLGKISFVTQSVSSILQLAVSLDYAIFLLHEFRHQKEIYEDNDIALERAIEISASSVISSALTTVFGFLALVFMKFGIGKDLGLVLAKGVFFSLISVVFFLPTLVKIFMKLIQKTEHRNFLPDFAPLSKLIVKTRNLIIFILIIVPITFIGQQRNNFTYGMGAYEEGSREQLDQEFIESVFGKNIQMVLLVPKGDFSKEEKMIQEIKSYSYIKSVQSYTQQVGTAIPSEIAPTEEIKSLLSDNYSRIILNASIEKEGDETFSFINKIRSIAKKYYNEDYKFIGEPVVLENMSNIVEKDNKLVNILAILSVAIVILFNFKSMSIPILLVLTIETSIWINLSIPYFSNTKLSFIGYLIISSIQLGATVDYAILYTNEYLEQRKIKTKKQVLIDTGAKVYGSIIPPALILMSAGIILSIVSSISLVSELGTVLGRGAFLSLILVMFLLPVLLYFFDKLIEKTTWKANFKKG